MPFLVRSRITLIVVVAFSASVLFFFLFTTTQANYTNDKIPRAAIIDQLYDDHKNLNFEQTAKGYFEQAGYKVDLYTTKDITVGFYKNLPSMGYKFIVIRSHASLSLDNATKSPSGNIFTGEKYRPDKYTWEQALGQVQRSMYIYLDYGFNFKNGSYSFNKIAGESGTYFSVGAKFVDEQMQGKFPGSIILVGGCASLSNPTLAASLVKRGASTIIGWNNLVSVDRNDEVMLAVIKGLLIDKSDVKDVVQSTMKQFGPDPLYSGVLKYYPT